MKAFIIRFHIALCCVAVAGFARIADADDLEPAIPYEDPNDINIPPVSPSQTLELLCFKASDASYLACMYYLTAEKDADILDPKGRKTFKPLPDESAEKICFYVARLAQEACLTKLVGIHRTPSA